MPASPVRLKGGESQADMLKLFAEAITPLLRNLEAKDGENLLILESIVNHASRAGAEAERAACALAISGLLDTDLPALQKTWLLRQLEVAGQAEAVSIEVKLFESKEPLVHEAARRALESNPSPEALIALRSLLAKAGDPDSSAALALSLATRKDTASIPAIVKLLPNERTAESAYRALARIGGPEAVAAIVLALPHAPPQAQLAAGSAALQCADQLLQAGHARESAALFQSVYAAKVPAWTRQSALRGQLRAEGENAGSKILDILQGADAAARTVALGYLKELAQPARKHLVDNFRKLPAALQPTVLESLANADERLALPLATEFAKDAEPARRLAGLGALARLDGEASAALLCQALVTAQTAAERQAIAEVICILPDTQPSTDAIVAAMKTGSPEATRSFLAALAKRGSRRGLPAILSATGVEDVPTARAAFQAFGNLAQAEDVPALLGLLAKLPRPEARADAESATVRALAKLATTGQKSQAVIAALGHGADVEARRSMLRLLVTCADTNAFEVVKVALADANPLIRETAVRAFADWPSTAAWKVLPGIYRNPEKEPYRVLALRGMARLAATQNTKLNPTWIARYKEMLAGARNDNDRRLIVGALSGATAPEALDIALSLLEFQGIRAEVELAVKKIAAAVKAKNPEAAQAALRALKGAGEPVKKTATPPAPATNAPPAKPTAPAAKTEKPKKAEPPVFLTPETAGPDLEAQGEYEGLAGDKKVGAQIIAYDNALFHAVIFNGGLPGAGWDGSPKVEFDGRRHGDKIAFASLWHGNISHGLFSGKTEKGGVIALKRVVRHSPTEGAPPPAGAVVLFDSSNSDAWTSVKMDDRKLLPHGARTKQSFGDCTLHLEFLLPFKPGARGQSRSNSGVYLQDRYEIQVLDSFGLKGLDNDCGGLYHQAAPKVNLCYPPLQWQTYDIDFTAARFDAAGKKTKNAVLTLKHNGVVIHENQEIKENTPAGKPESAAPGPLHFQSKGPAHPIFYRNVWLVEKK